MPPQPPQSPPSALTSKKAGPQAKTPIEFFAIIEKASKESGKTIRQRVPEYLALDRKLADELSTVFRTMTDDFFQKNSTVVEFDGRYTPGIGEVFVIHNFKLDAAIAKAAASPLTTPVLSLGRSPFPQIKAIIATEVNSPLRIVFQEFRTDQIIRRGWAFVQLHGKDTFNRVDSSGIAIGSDIDAVYDGGSLYFRSYYTANRFADLTEYFKDATDDDIKDLIKSEPLVTNNLNELLEHTDTAMRRKFSIIKKTEILSLVSAKEIQAAATVHGIDVAIQMSDGVQCVVIPPEKAEAKDLLDFLCQGMFVGPLTKELFISNSHRPKKSAATKSAAKPAAKKAAKKTPPKKS